MDIEKQIADVQTEIKNLKQPPPKRKFGLMSLLLLLILMVCVVSGIDYSRISNAKANLTAALDSSALYAAATTGKTEAELKVLARAYVEQNYISSDGAELTAFDLHDYADRVEITGTVQVKTWIMRIVGVTTVEVPVSSQIMKTP